jgi:exodeoxyribonuclease VII small subunit
MAKEPTFDDIPTMSFENAMEELETIVRAMESGELPLEQAMGDYTRGAALRAHCAKKLEDAKLKVEKITQAADGSLSATEFDAA